MYTVILNSENKAGSFSKNFAAYSYARDYANRVFHKRYTLSTRQQGFPADDFIVFNKSHFAGNEEVTVHNPQDSFHLLIIKVKNTPPEKSQPETKTTLLDLKKTFDKQIYSIKDHKDNIHIKQQLMQNMLERNPVCQGCGKTLSSQQNTTIKKIDARAGYTLDNCFLKHRRCHSSDTRTSIQFIDFD